MGVHIAEHLAGPGSGSTMMSSDESKAHGLAPGSRGGLAVGDRKTPEERVAVISVHKRGGLSASALARLSAKTSCFQRKRGTWALSAQSQARRSAVAQPQTGSKRMASLG